MPTQVKVTQADIDSIAGKLDQFAAVLTDEQRLIILGVLEYAGIAIRAAASAAPTPAAPPPAATALPPLSTGFRDAFKNGVGSTFSFDNLQTEKISGEVGVKWGMEAMRA
jgi:hypothetical protein